MTTEAAIVSELKKYYPDIYKKILVSSEISPVVIAVSDLSMVINSYCIIKGIDGPVGRKLKADHKKELYAVLMLLYHPQKIYGVSKSPYPAGLVSRIAVLMDEQPSTTYWHMQNTIGYFSIYKNFREEAKRIASLVVEDLSKK